MKHMACILLIITVLFAGFAVAEDYAAYTISDTYYAQSAPTVMANGDLFYLKPTTVDTRVFQYFSDHTFSTLVQTDSSSWVFCPGYGLDEATDMPPVMVPFDVLPTADNAYGLTLK